MESSDSRLRELGDALAEAQDVARRQRINNGGEVRRAFARALAAGFLPRAAGRLVVRPRAVLVVLGVLLGVGAGVHLFRSRARPLSFVVGPAAEPGRVGAWLAAPPAGELTLAFSDGTAVVLEAGARARVVVALDRGARLLLESGGLRVASRAAAGRWTFDAGPLSVETRGARLDLAWDPGLERFTGTVFDGAADVQGDCLQGVRPIRPGETIDISCRPEPVRAAP